MDNEKNNGIKCRIDYVFNLPKRKVPQLLVAILEKNAQFGIHDTSTLGGYGVKSISGVRALDENGEPRMDLFAFQLKNKSDLIHFRVGQLVKFVQ